MPKMYRTMMPDESGKPKLGCEGGPGLGVRVPPDPHPDVTPDSEGNIRPGTDGMSVAPSILVMPRHLVPKRLKSLRRDARGNNDRIVFSMGEGQFHDAPIADMLQLRVTSATHGSVEPAEAMAIEDFQKLLAETQGLWRKDEF